MKLSSIMQFRAARKASEEVGAQIVLGDRPIEITVCVSLLQDDTISCFSKCH